MSLKQRKFQLDPWRTGNVEGNNGFTCKTFLLSRIYIPAAV